MKEYSRMNGELKKYEVWTGRGNHEHREQSEQSLRIRFVRAIKSNSIRCRMDFSS